jgi:polyisoprenoid-binding protein YceI
VIYDKKFLKNRDIARFDIPAKLQPIAMKSHSILTSVALLAAPAFVNAATLEVDQARSRIQVDASATGHNFTGNLKKFTANANGDAGSLAPSSFDLQWSFKDLDTDDAKRDQEMVKWLGGGDPKGSFAFTKSWTDKAGKTHGMGSLTIHGVSKAVSFPYTVKKDGEWVTIDGTASLDYQNFKLPIIRSMAVMTVDPKLTVRFHVVGKVK